jgi:CCR4-NOT transcription complex subunit 6
MSGIQEVDSEQYEDYFLRNLSGTRDGANPEDGDHAIYKGVFEQKSRARTMSATEKKSVDGCAIFYRTSTYVL